MSTDFTARIIGMVVIGIAGSYWGASFGANIPDVSSTWYATVMGLVGALVGLILTPYVTTRPARAARAMFRRIEATILLAGLMGLVVVFCSRRRML